MNQHARALSRIFWHMGQALLPEHFFGQEESLRAESALRFSMLSAPAWGLGKLVWDTFQLPAGVLSIKELALVFESGTVVAVPGNASPVLLDLNTLGRARSPIYLQLQSSFELMSTGADDPGEEGIQRILQKIELSASQSAAEQTFHLAEVQCSAEGVWSFAEDYVPPLLRVRRNLLFDGPLARMEGVANALGSLLKEELQQNHLSGETQLLAKQTLRSLFSFQAALTDLDGRIEPHPYELFQALRALYIDVCVLRNASPEAIGRPYDHREIAASFNALLTPLEQMLARGRADVPYVELTRKDGLYSCALAPTIRRAKDVFLLVQKPAVATKVDLSRVKMSSPSRIQLVHERALSGIPFTRIERPPFAATLSSTVEMYVLQRGQEWDHAVGEGQVVLFDVPQLDGCRLYLYCRLE